MSPEEKEIAENISRLNQKSGKEPVASFLKMELAELSPGYARVTMKLTPQFQNFHGLVFGGIIMALADQAFGYASNSLSFPSVASQFNTHFLAGARVGDELTAECRVVKSSKRVGVSEITVTNQDGRLIAKATGTTIPVKHD